MGQKKKNCQEKMKIKKGIFIALHALADSPGGGLLNYDLGRDVPLRLEK